MHAVMLALALASGQDARRPDDGGRIARKLAAKSRDELKAKVREQAKEKRDAAAKSDKAAVQSSALRVYTEIQQDLVSVGESLRKIADLEDAGKAAQQAKRNDAAVRKVADEHRKKVLANKSRPPSQATLESQIHELVSGLHEEFRANAVIADLLWDADDEGAEGAAAELSERNLALGARIIDLTLAYVSLTGDRMDDEVFESWVETLDRYLEYCYVEDLED